MAQVRSKVYVHLTFSTRQCKPMIDEEIEQKLHTKIRKICKRLKCKAVEVGGYTDHIHILCRLHPYVSQEILVQSIKTESTQWIRKQDGRYKKFAWQGSYGIFSVGETQIDSIKDFIRNQHRYHKHISFEEEFKATLMSYHLSYNDTLVWQ